MFEWMVYGMANIQILWKVKVLVGSEYVCGNSVRSCWGVGELPGGEGFLGETEKQ